MKLPALSASNSTTLYSPTVRPSEIPLLDFDRVARLDLGLRRGLDADHAAVGVEALEVEVVLARPVGVAASHGDRLQRRHVGDIGIVAGLLDLADHVERTAGDDLGADAGVITRRPFYVIGEVQK